MYSILDGADRDVKFLGDLMVFETTEIHHERSTVVFVEVANGVVDILHRKLRVGKVKGHAARRVYVVQVIGRVDESTLANQPLVVGDERVFHDRVQPCLKVGAIRKFITVHQCLDHGVLQQVISIFNVFGKTHGKRLKRFAGL